MTESDLIDAVLKSRNGSCELMLHFVGEIAENRWCAAIGDKLYSLSPKTVAAPPKNIEFIRCGNSPREALELLLLAVATHDTSDTWKSFLRIKNMLPTARTVGARHGVNHPVWNAIRDAEALLEGRRTSLCGGPEEAAPKVAEAMRIYVQSENNSFVDPAAYVSPVDRST